MKTSYTAVATILVITTSYTYAARTTTDGTLPPEIGSNKKVDCPCCSDTPPSSCAEALHLVETKLEGNGGTLPASLGGSSEKDAPPSPRAEALPIFVQESGLKKCNCWSDDDCNTSAGYYCSQGNQCQCTDSGCGGLCKCGSDDGCGTPPRPNPVLMSPRPGMLSFVETELEGNKCTCNTNYDCAPDEYCKISNCNDHGYSGGRCKPRSDLPPPPAPREPQCYNYGDYCEEDSDCLTGGFNPCTTCSSNNKCYTPLEPPEQPQCYNLGEPCDTDSDCWQGGTNMCTTCGQYVGTEYYKRCFTPDYPIPTPMPTEPEPGMCGQQCNSDNDCQQPGPPGPPGPPTPPNTCTVCSKNLPGCVGCMWQCVDPSEWPYTNEEESVKYLRASRK